jgi:hypothetical protein
LDAPLEIGVMHSDAGADITRAPLVSELPVDSESKSLGTKVFAKVPTSLYRNPRLNATETYRIPAGTPLWVRPTGNRDWMQVRLSRGRSAYVRTGDTSAALALATAQGALADRTRLSPRPQAPDEADAGDGRSSTPPSGNAALNQAIEEAVSAFESVGQQMDRLTAEYAGFQGDSADWPKVRSGFSTQLGQMSTEMQGFNQALQEVAEHSSGMSSNMRSAYQSAVAQTATATEAIRGARSIIDQMRDGEDWTSLVQSLGDRMAELNSAVDSIEASLDRMQ